MILRWVRFVPCSFSRLMTALSADEGPTLILAFLSPSNTSSTLFSIKIPHVLRLQLQFIQGSIYMCIKHALINNLPEFSHCNLCLRETVTAISLASNSDSFFSSAFTSCRIFTVSAECSSLLPVAHIVNMTILVRMLQEQPCTILGCHCSTKRLHFTCTPSISLAQNATQRSTIYQSTVENQESRESVRERGQLPPARGPTKVYADHVGWS